MFDKPPKKEEVDSQIEQKDKIARFESVYNKAQKFLRRIQQASIVVAMGLSVHYVEINSDQVEKISENGKEIFKHSDEETNRLLNYISGTDSISSEERVNILKLESKIKYLRDSVDIPENFDQMNMEEFIEYSFNVNVNNYNGKETKEEYLLRFNKWVDKKIPKKYDYDSTLYNAVWETEKECGSPNVRLTFGQNKIIKSNDLSLVENSDIGIAHYNPLTNTIYINPINYNPEENAISELIQEWPHSKQLHDDYLKTLASGIASMARMAKDVIYSKNFIVSQKKEYNIPGSLEYDAHKIILPEIEKKFKDIRCEE
ncbi:MAG: hypothetical protein JJE53_03265 [Candidatus Pacebacteria bacterium]|nr:hypothetical protein [Candidatus Paceibacterota bacterium]